MNGIQLDLFTFAAMQIQEKSAEAKSAVLLKNFINDGKFRGLSLVCPVKSFPDGVKKAELLFQKIEVVEK